MGKQLISSLECISLQLHNHLMENPDTVSPTGMEFHLIISFDNRMQIPQ